MGKAPVTGIENPDEFAFLIAEKLGENSWMKHLWSKKETLGALAGLVSLVMSGCVYAPTVRTGLGDIWTTKYIDSYSFTRGIKTDNIKFIGNFNGDIFASTEWDTMQYARYGDGSAIIAIAEWSGNYYASTLNGKILKSANGTSGWNEVYSTSYVFQDIETTDDRIVFFTTSSVQIYTTDGVNFQTNKTTGMIINGVIKIGGMYYGYNTAGTIYKSLDMVSWSVVYASGIPLAGYLASGNGLTLVTGQNGLILYSYDMINWHTDYIVSGLSGYVTPASVYINGRFYVSITNDTTNIGKIYVFSKIGEYKEIYSGVNSVNQFIIDDDDLVSLGADLTKTQGIDVGRGVLMKSSYLEAGAGIISQNISENNAVIKFSGGFKIEMFKYTTTTGFSQPAYPEAFTSFCFPFISPLYADTTGTSVIPFISGYSRFDCVVSVRSGATASSTYLRNVVILVMGV
jgi:hypothetical protein